MITDDHRRFDWITEKAIGCANQVHNALGRGFLEKCYENALAHERRQAGLDVRQQVTLDVRYDGVVVGNYVADLVVEKLVLVELKAASGIDATHKAQCINYPAATGSPLALLINFGQRVTVNRMAGPGLRSAPIGAPSVAKE